MKALKKLSALLLIAAILCTVLSCHAGQPEDTTVTVTDQMGRTVTLPEAAKRVVSCYYVTSYAMLALGVSDRLVGIEKKADTRPIYAMVNSALLDLPAVGSLKEINIEAIAAQNPDLVILPKKLSSSVDAIEALGIPTLIVNPETDADMRGMLTLLGDALGVPDRAAQLLAFYDSKLGGFEAPAEKPTVLFLGNSSFLTAAPAAMYQNDVITLAGGVNALADSTENYWQTLSYEAILQLNPTYLVIPCGADYTAADIAADSVLKDLDAVKNGRILSFPTSFEEWDSPIPSGVLGILWLRAALNPSVYSPETFRKDMTEFYETFYGFTPAAEALDTLF